MGSTLVFKTTASVIKPTRETMLDYSSYILLALSIIAFARVLIGSTELSHMCNQNGSVIIANVNNVSATSINSSWPLETEIDKDPVIMDNKDDISYHDTKHYSYCKKYFQAHFPYILGVESFALLLLGIFWVKMPKVNFIVSEFSKLLRECRKSNWFKNSATCLSSFSLMSDNMEAQNFLTTLFDAATSYNDRAEARCLYEKIQKFSHDHEHSQTLVSLYIRKTIVQLLLWLTSFVINMALFVNLEFYIGCSSLTMLCSHDTFLRIVWFLSQLLLLIYGVFNCVTLKWIHDNFTSSRNCSWLYFLCACSKNSIAEFQYFPYWLARGKAVHNDFALLLHLVSSCNRVTVSHVTIFLLDDWLEKFALHCSSDI